MMSEDIFDEAKRLVTGPRREAYGPVEQSFKEIAAMWGVILRREVTCSEVALCMIALKLQREAHSHHRDNLVDICGYTNLLNELSDQRHPV